MQPHPVSTDRAPQSSSPISQAIAVGDLVFVSGQVGRDPVTGRIVEGGTGPETRQSLKNLRAILEAAGSSIDFVVKTTCFLIDMSEFETFNKAYAACFEAKLPARSTIGVASLAAGYRVEIEAVAWIPAK